MTSAPLPDDFDWLRNLSQPGLDGAGIAPELRRLFAEYDRRGTELAGFAWAEMLTEQTCPAGKHASWYVDSEHHHACPWCAFEAARAASLQITEWRAAERVERDMLSRLLRGMARRVGNLRKNGRHFVGVTEKLQDRLDSAFIERDDLQTELSVLDRLRRNHDALADTYVATREALDHARARVAGVRAVHAEVRVDDEGYRGCVHCGGDYPCDTLQALDGPS